MPKLPRRSAAKPSTPKQGPSDRPDDQVTEHKGTIGEAGSGQTPKVSNATQRKPGGAAASKTQQPDSSKAERSIDKREAAGSIPVPATPDGTTDDDTADHLAGLNPKQVAFVAEYLKSKNASKAYMLAYGVSERTANANGFRMMENHGVRSAIEAANAKVVSKSALSLDRTLLEIARLAYFDPRKMFDADGKPLALHELDDDTAAVIAGLDISETRDGDGLKVEVKKWKLADKKGALDMAMKHLGGYKADNAQAGEAAAAALLGIAVRFVEPGKA